MLHHEPEKGSRRFEVGDPSAPRSLDSITGVEPTTIHDAVTTPLESKMFRDDSGAAYDAIAAVQARFPNLSRSGFRLPEETDDDFQRARYSMLANDDTHDCIDQFVRGIQFIEPWPRVPFPNKTMGAHHWAHTATRWHVWRGASPYWSGDSYVSHGMLIAAAAHLRIAGGITRGRRAGTVYLCLRSVPSHPAWSAENLNSWFAKVRAGSCHG